MAQNDFIELPAVRYTRADFTALRAHLNRFADLCYCSEDDGDRLDHMRDKRVQSARNLMPHPDQTAVYSGNSTHPRLCSILSFRDWYGKVPYTDIYRIKGDRYVCPCST